LEATLSELKQENLAIQQELEVLKLKVCWEKLMLFLATDRIRGVLNHVKMI
jgi:hypothetical protein